MALLYHTNKIDISSNDVVIRRIDDGDYAIALTFPDEDDTTGEAVTEVLLTEAEVKEAYDVLFNR